MKNYKVDAAAAVTVERMLQQLAGVCDGAASLDGQGFSAHDVAFGHSLANQSQRGQAWTVKQAACALALVRKYQRQLGGKQFIDQFLNQPVFACEPIDHTKPIGGTAESSSTSDRMILLHDTNNFSIKFKYNAALVSAIKQHFRKQHHGRTFWASWTGTCWTVPLNATSYQLLQQFAAEHQFSVSKQVHAAADAFAQADAAQQHDAALLRLNDGCNVTLVGNEMVVAIEDPTTMQQFVKYLAA